MSLWSSAKRRCHRLVWRSTDCTAPFVARCNGSGSLVGGTIWNKDTSRVRRWNCGWVWMASISEKFGGRRSSGGGARRAAPLKNLISSISCRFVLWEAASETKHCNSLKFKVIERTPKIGGRWRKSYATQEQKSPEARRRRPLLHSRRTRPTDKKEIGPEKTFYAKCCLPVKPSPPKVFYPS